MKKRILKKTEVLREGYVKGLKHAQRIIKEAMEAHSGTTFRATLKDAEIVENVYADGEQPDTEYFTSWDLSFNFTDAKDFREKMEREVGGTDFFVTYDVDMNKQVCVNWVGDENWHPLDKQEIADWRKGKIKGYNCYMWFKVSVTREATDEEMLSMFDAM